MRSEGTKERTGLPVLLLVEDNGDEELLMLRFLKKAQVQNPVVVARDGVEALAYLGLTDSEQPMSGAQLPAMVILDIKLPKLNGLKVLKMIRAEKRTRCLPVVMFSSSDQKLDVRRSYELGANSYVRKPVNFEDYSEVVERIVRYWLNINVRLPRPARGEQ